MRPLPRMPPPAPAWSSSSGESARLIRMLKQEVALDQPHAITIRWGPWRRDVGMRAGPMRSVVLMHTKSNAGMSVPILLTVNPPCFVTFGCGQAPGGTTIDINHGWVRGEE